MRIPGGKAVQRLISQAYVELIFPLATHYFTVNPLIKQMDEAGKGYLRKQVRDPTVRDALTPRYAVGCKRPGFHNTYFSTFTRENVRLITEPIDKITGAGVATTDGESHDIDVLILATGFKVTDTDNVPTYPVTGLGGRSLAQFWDENRLQAYEGVSIPGFPNLFTVYGPYGFVGSSYFVAQQRGKVISAPPRMVAYSAAALIGQLAHRRLITDDGVTAADVADFVVEFIGNALRPRKSSAVEP
jgi:cation diffusion facilitator CzcD-associated flavoprotein CzcO